MATHSSILAWRIPGMGEPGGLLSRGSHRVGHDSRDLAAAAAAVSDIRPEYWFRYSNVGFDMTSLETTIISSYKKDILLTLLFEVHKMEQSTGNSRKETSR